MTGIALAVLAVLLAWPAPSALARSAWVERAPRAGVVLWQALALAAVLAAVGAALAAPEEALRAWTGSVEFGAGLLLAAGLAAVLAGVIVVRLVWVTIRLGLRTRRRRARHAELLHLLDTADPDDLRMHVLTGPVPMAYCIPGRSQKVVVTDAALALLDAAEIDAVIEHERAHLRARHDLVLEAFTALHVSFPRFARSRAALDAVHRLLEMLADDAAAARVDPQTLSSALAKLGSTAESDAIQVRRARLQAGHPAHGQLAGAGAYLSAVAVLAVPTLVLVEPWLRAAMAAIGR
ncbi:M48 family metalloprotease [Ruania zhangjianzhongii]|uniref:M48 family metalloprotease n=1 Tax=Ruania zhangjianzhongii TaxID=2603206 RepID=UPI0011C9EC4C|nr:M48 family metalloprotease [Ruania zhangjianzhongii]